MPRTVTDQEFRSVYEDSDNQRLIKCVLRKYAHIIPRDELESAGLEATWKCLQRHEEGRQKFTSSLWRFVRWECQTRQKKYIRQQKIDALIQENEADTPIRHVKKSCKLKKINEALCILPQEFQVIVERYCVSNMSFREIGKEINMSTEGVRQRYQKAISFIRDACITN